MQPQAHGFFDGLMRWQVPEHGVQTPLFFRDLSAFGAVFTAASDAVRPLLPDARLRLVEHWPGRCLALVLAVQYRDSDLGPYEELALAFPAAAGERVLPAMGALREGLRGSLSAWTWQMPVSTDVACRVGRGIAGFPKEVADVRITRSGGQWEATLQQQGEAALRLRCRAGDGGAGERTVSLRSYTVLQGITLQNHLLVRQTRYQDLLGGDSVRLELGSGPWAQQLRALGLGESALAAHVCSQGQAMLFHPRNLRDD
jgi:hypothetical protein